ncbi:hypothetical protein DFH07DRAFT_950194 [Mycena maculata]|uniref:Uncharacterized protein n=1 Tax=Mycena maculata TaxID=230809 RepID=A0AAD7K9R8_9AGAR|nr:hypothetical protein DFH07DRAFT_950194 [Mycena maculata]
MAAGLVQPRGWCPPFMWLDALFVPWIEAASDGRLRADARAAKRWHNRLVDAEKKRTALEAGLAKHATNKRSGCDACSRSTPISERETQRGGLATDPPARNQSRNFRRRLRCGPETPPVADAISGDDIFKRSSAFKRKP